MLIFVTKIRDVMRIIAKSTLVDYYTKNPKAKSALEEWYEKTKKSEWTCFADIRFVGTHNEYDAIRDIQNI